MIFFPLMRLSLADSYRFCEQVARREAGNFYHAFRVLPRGQRQAMCALYAFLRLTDDLGDSLEPTATKRALLADWRQQFERSLAGDYTHSLHPAFHDTINNYQIPTQYLHDVIDGVEMDLDTASYPTFADLYRYCYRVASAVGLACIHIWGFTDDRGKEYAEKAGIAFQLTNILRDLGEDAARGRIYLPLEDLERFDYPASKLAQKERDDHFRSLMRFQVERARNHYELSQPLTPLLNPPGRAVFQVMTRTYRGLLDAMENRDYDVFSSRICLSQWRKLGLVLQALPVRLGWG
jgi:15-cis-phytoene synthase